MHKWKVNKIGVIGPGIVGMPMAALLADARITIGSDEPARVVVVQRDSPTSGWKVDAINQGESVIGGIEPELDEIVIKAVKNGLLQATHNYSALSDADVVLVCVQTDKKGEEPDYGPLMGALTYLAKALQQKPADSLPLIIIESTLAPSSMQTVVRHHFKSFGLIEGVDVLLGNSPNRVMPGRLAERVKSSDKLIAGLQPQTVQKIKQLYSHVVTEGHLLETNSLTAEIEKTLENAYRDVRIAFSAEVAMFCDEQDVDFYKLRDRVNERLSQSDNASHNANEVPRGGLLIPTIGVGGHCLPKDGVLLWWRKLESGLDASSSLILESRKINDASPAQAIMLAEKNFGSLKGKSIGLLGAAYRFNSEDTRNSPTLVLANLLKKKNCIVNIHDPYVKGNDQNILKMRLENELTSDLDQVLRNADYLFLCVAHQNYTDEFERIASQENNLLGLFDGCNLMARSMIDRLPFPYAGIGKGHTEPSEEIVEAICLTFRALEIGIANEVNELIDFYNERFISDEFNRAEFSTVQQLAATCSTGCLIGNTGPVTLPESAIGFQSVLAHCALKTNKPLMV